MKEKIVFSSINKKNQFMPIKVKLFRLKKLFYPKKILPSNEQNKMIKEKLNLTGENYILPTNAP